MSAPESPPPTESERMAAWYDKNIDRMLESLHRAGRRVMARHRAEHVAHSRVMQMESDAPQTGGGLRALASRIEKLERESEELKTMGIRLVSCQHMTNAKSELPEKEARPLKKLIEELETDGYSVSAVDGIARSILADRRGTRIRVFLDEE